MLLLHALLGAAIAAGHVKRRKEGGGKGEPPAALLCVPCKPGHAHHLTILCAAGFSPANETCAPCPLGTEAPNATMASCRPCQAGWVAPVKGTVVCTPCGEGETSYDGNSRCSGCPYGTVNNVTGSACTPCPAGFASPIRGGVACDPCGPGTFNDLVGQRNCRPCGRGFWNSDYGGLSFDASCRPCPGGFECPYEATAEATPCPANTFCPPQSARASPCPPLHTAPAKATRCQATEAFYIVIGAVSCAALSLLLCLIRAKLQRAAARRKADEVDAAIDEARHLIPKAPGPVYTGL